MFNKNFLDKIIKRDKEKTNIPSVTSENIPVKKPLAVHTENPKGSKNLESQDVLDMFSSEQITNIKKLKQDIIDLQTKKRIAADNHDISEFGDIHPAVFEMMKREIDDINDQINTKQKEIDDLVGNN